MFVQGEAAALGNDLPLSAAVSVPRRPAPMTLEQPQRLGLLLRLSLGVGSLR